MLRVGHGGAAAVVPGNTLASFDAALALGVDMIEFDVRARGGELVLAHYPWNPRRRACPTLRDALRHLASPRFGGLRFNVDLKSEGTEAATLFALEQAGLTDRCVLSSQVVSVLDRVRELDPSVRTGVSIGGRLGRRQAGWPADWRSRVFAVIEQRRFDAVMAFHGLVDAALADGVRERGGELFAWTVDDRRLLDRLRDIGVTGAISNDPRLFTPVAAVRA
jgi:glycerophosphoryl diester phosphodiesterase